MRTRIARIVAVIGALVGWAALVVQFVILVGEIRGQRGTFLLAVWRFVGFFTILTNILVAMVLTHAALRPESSAGLGNPKVRLASATAIAMVGIVYSAALRELWSPEGWQKMADVALHDFVPVIFLTFFFACRYGTLRARDSVYGLVLPFAYVVYALARGEIDGWYAYYFLDPTKLTVTRMFVNATVLFLGFWVLGLLIVGVTKLLRGRVK
jgi:hypothetical protein